MIIILIIRAQLIYLILITYFQHEAQGKISQVFDHKDS